MCGFITGLFKLCCRHNEAKWHNSLRLHILSEESFSFLCLSEYLSWEENILLPGNKIFLSVLALILVLNIFLGRMQFKNYSGSKTKV